MRIAPRRRSRAPRGRRPPRRRAIGRSRARLQRRRHGACAPRRDGRERPTEAARAAWGEEPCQEESDVDRVPGGRRVTAGASPDRRGDQAPRFAPRGSATARRDEHGGEPRRGAAATEGQQASRVRDRARRGARDPRLSGLRARLGVDRGRSRRSRQARSVARAVLGPHALEVRATGSTKYAKP